jgi:drug/metabolite transporter (DMT)-like permease
VQILFFGVGPLTVAWLDARVTATRPVALSASEHALRVGLAGALVLAAGVVLAGRSGLGPQPAGPALAGVALALGGGTSIALSQLLCRTLNDAGVGPATLIALRFPGAVILAAALASTAGGDVLGGVTPGALAGVGLASFLLIVVPNYVNQVGVALASPLTIRSVLAVGPVLVFLLQALEGRVSPSSWTLAVSVLYALLAVAAAVARHRAVTAPRGLPRIAAATR